MNFKHILLDIFSIFKVSSKSHKIKREKLFQFVQVIKESYDSILVNDKSFSFINVKLDENEDNKLLLKVLNELKNSTILINIVNALHEHEIENLKKKLNSYYQEKFELTSNTFSLNANFLEKDIDKVKKKVNHISNSKMLFLVNTILTLPKTENLKNISIRSARLNLKFFLMFFRQLEGIKQLFFKIDNDFKEYDLLSSLRGLSLKEIQKSPSFNDMLIGKNMDSNVLIFDNFFKYENFNSVIFAKSGAGKSFLAKLLIKRFIFLGINIVIFDPEGEYIDITSNLGGINFTAIDTNHIDSLLLRSNTKEYLDGLINILFKDDYERDKVKELLVNIREYKDLKENIPLLPEEYIRKILKYIKLDGLVDNRVSSNLINFQIEGEDLSLYLYKIASMCLYRNIGKTILFIDEAHKIMDDIEIVKFLRMIAKRGRKYEVGIVVITQDIIDFLQNSWSKSIIYNSTFKFILKQERISIPLIDKIFGANDYDDFLLNAKVGEGLFIKNEEINRMQFIDL